ERDVELVDPQVQDRIIEFARRLQRPERGALRDHAVDIIGRAGFGRRHRDGGDARGAIDVDIDEAVAQAGRIDGALERGELYTLAAAVAPGRCGEFLRALGEPCVDLAGWRNLVDQAPSQSALALD